MEVDSSP